MEVRETRVNGILVVSLAVCLLAAYANTIYETAVTITSSEDMAHGFFAPIVAAYLFWTKRKRAFSQSVSSRWGLPIIGFAATLALFAAVGGSSTFSRFALLISLAGTIVLIGGAHALRVLLFPLLLLLFTIPIPPVLYGQITLPLQMLATRLSEHLLDLIGITAYRDGNILQLPHGTLSVVEACSGIRSLITLAFFCITYAYLFAEKRWVGILLTASAIPASMLLNVARITFTGIFVEKAPQFTHGIYHEVLGWLCFLAGFGLVFLLHQLLRKGVPNFPPRNVGERLA